MTGDSKEVDYTYTRFLLCDDRWQQGGQLHIHRIFTVWWQVTTRRLTTLTPHFYWVMTDDNKGTDYTYTRFLLCDDSWTTRRSTTLTPGFVLLCNNRWTTRLTTLTPVYCVMPVHNKVDYTYSRLCGDRRTTRRLTTLTPVYCVMTDDNNEADCTYTSLLCDDRWQQGGWLHLHQCTVWWQVTTRRLTALTPVYCVMTGDNMEVDYTYTSLLCDDRWMTRMLTTLTPVYCVMTDDNNEADYTYTSLLCDDRWMTRRLTTLAPVYCVMTDDNNEADYTYTSLLCDDRWQHGGWLHLHQFTVWWLVDDKEVDYTYTSVLCDDKWMTRRLTTLTPVYCVMTGDNMEVDYTYTSLLCDDRWMTRRLTTLTPVYCVMTGGWQGGWLHLHQFTVWWQVHDKEVDYTYTSLQCDDRWMTRRLTTLTPVYCVMTDDNNEADYTYTSLLCDDRWQHGGWLHLHQFTVWWLVDDKEVDYTYTSVLCDDKWMTRRLTTLTPVYCVMTGDNMEVDYTYTSLLCDDRWMTRRLTTLTPVYCVMTGGWQGGWLHLHQFTVWWQVDDKEVDYTYTSVLCDDRWMTRKSTTRTPTLAQVTARGAQFTPSWPWPRVRKSGCVATKTVTIWTALLPSADSSCTKTLRDDTSFTDYTSAVFRQQDMTSESVSYVGQKIDLYIHGSER